jgi:hypothetical protein
MESAPGEWCLNTDLGTLTGKVLVQPFSIEWTFRTSNRLSAMAPRLVSDADGHVVFRHKRALGLERQLGPRGTRSPPRDWSHRQMMDRFERAVLRWGVGFVI